MGLAGAVAGRAGLEDWDELGPLHRDGAHQGEAALGERLLQVHRKEIPLRLRVAYEWMRDPMGAPPEPPMGE